MEARTLQERSKAAAARTPTSRALWQSNAAVVAFCVAFFATLTIALLQSTKLFYYDSGLYWSLGESFTLHGHFSLLNFTSPLRGYLYPLITHGLRGIAVALKWSYSYSAKVFNALLVASIGALLAPRLAELAWPHCRWGIRRRLALTALLIVFWHGYLDYPLSDFPALAVALVALISIARTEHPGWMLLAGVACGAAIDMRPAYVLLVPLVMLLVVWAWVRPRNASPSGTRRRMLCAALLATGFLVISLPQSLASHRHFHTWSFMPGAPYHLSSLQLTEGMRLQRYETYVAPNHPPRMEYADTTGASLLSQQPHGAITDTGQYIGLVVRHPLMMAGILLRHLVNGMDQRYTTPYVTHLDKGWHRGLRFAGLTLFFLALLRVLWPAARHKLGTTRWRWPVALALSSLTAIPSAMETRYLLPLYLLSYVLVLLPRWPSPVAPAGAWLRRYRTTAVIVGVYLPFMALALHVASGASHHLHFG